MVDVCNGTGRPPKRCKECSPTRRAWAAKPEAERRAIAARQHERRRLAAEIERSIVQALDELEAAA